MSSGFHWLLIALVLAGAASSVPAQSLPVQSPQATQPPQAWLMTYGTADRVEEKYGHNAIWIRDDVRGIDTIYNFGFFDFDKPGFFLDYISGDLVYFAVAREPAEELAYYRWRDRSVRAQRLNLDDSTIHRLTDWLEERVTPENRDFHYDYFFNNCSNRVRDALDFALDGALRSATEELPARLNFRQHTRRLVEDDPLLYLGIHAALGPMVDRSRSVWEEMFLPEVVARTVTGMQVPGADGTMEPLVLAERMLYESTRTDSPDRPEFAWALMLSLLAASLLIILAPVALAGRRRGWALIGSRAWIVAISLGGLVLAFLWLATDHQAAWRNENLLLFNPLALLLLRFRGGRVEKVAAAVVAAGLVLALVLKLLPGTQWNYDLLLWLVPAQASVLGVWLWSLARGDRVL